jgi:hypothetical protein
MKARSTRYFLGTLAAHLWIASIMEANVVVGWCAIVGIRSRTRDLATQNVFVLFPADKSHSRPVLPDPKYFAGVWPKEALKTAINEETSA